MRAGISSVSNSKRNWATVSGGALFREPALAAAFGKSADAADISRTLGHGNNAAGIEQIEGMARLDTLVISGERQGPREQRLALFLGIEKMAEQELGVGVLEIVRGELELRAL